MAVEDARAVAAEDAREVAGVAMTIRATRVNPENHAGSLSALVKYDSSLPTMKKMT